MKPPKSAPGVALCGWDQDELKAIAVVLKKIGYTVHAVRTIQELDKLLRSRPIESIMVHLSPSRQEFLSLLGRLGLPPVIALLGYSDRYLYPELLRRGAFDCVPLSAEGGELKRVLSLAGENKGHLAVSKIA